MQQLSSTKLKNWSELGVPRRHVLVIKVDGEDVVFANKKAYHRARSQKLQNRKITSISIVHENEVARA